MKEKKPVLNEGRKNLGNETVTIAVTHKNADLDGRLAKIFLEIGGSKINQMIFWGGGYLNLPTETRQVIFLDCSPSYKLKRSLQEKGIELTIVDHHPHTRYPDPTDEEYPYKTTVSMLAEQLEKKLNLADEKIKGLVKWSKRADFQSGGDPMNIISLMQKMNLCYSDQRVQEWTEVMIESELEAKEVDLEQGKKFFTDYLSVFLKENHELGAREKFQRFLERAKKPEIFQDSMNIISRTAKMLAKFGEEDTKEWLSTAIRSIEERQQKFLEASEEVKEATIAVTGNSVVIVGVSDIPEFGQAARRYARRAHGKVPIVAKIQPKNKGFQIFGDGKNDLREVVKALRVEILEARGKKVPLDWKILQQDGVLQGTEPLYYHKAGFSVVMWGSLTKPDVPSVDIPEYTLKEVLMKVLDLNFFPDVCKKSKICQREECPFYKYLLQRCSQRRSQHRYENDRPQDRKNNRRTYSTREDRIAREFQRKLGSAVSIKIEQ